jgi:phosphatidylserine/phosphatidylglycerophosphate/cardiolipin synthase-like enzyme
LVVFAMSLFKCSVSLPLRVSPSGEPYEPVHDLQAAVTGAAARALADLVRQRWERATGALIEPHAPLKQIWPEGLDSNLGDCMLGISLTEPASTAAAAAGKQ